MQATIYVTKEAMDTATAIKDMDYYTRVSMFDNGEADMSNLPGYYLKNASKLNLEILPANANVALTLSPNSPAPFARVVSMPAELRGCIFEKAPKLPERYAEIVTFWSGEPINVNDTRAVHFQSQLNEYLVELRPASGANEKGEVVAVDRLLSEGIVVSVTGTAALIDGLPPDDFVEIVMPIDRAMVGIEPDDFQSTKAYQLAEDECVERIFIAVADIRRSPNPNHILIDAIRNELLDYGYWY